MSDAKRSGHERPEVERSSQNAGQDAPRSTPVRVTQVRSRNGSDHRQRETLRSLGLRRIGHTVEHEPTPQVRGMLHAVRHLVKVEGSS